MNTPPRNLADKILSVHLQKADKLSAALKVEIQSIKKAIMGDLKAGLSETEISLKYGSQLKAIANKAKTSVPIIQKNILKDMSKAKVNKKSFFEFTNAFLKKHYKYGIYSVIGLLVLKSILRMYGVHYIRDQERTSIGEAISSSF